MMRIRMIPVLLALLTLGPVTLMGREVRSPKPEQPARVSAEQLDESIDRVIRKREYRWRLPRERRREEAPRSLLEEFLDGILNSFRGWFRPIRTWLGKVQDWINDHMPVLRPQSGEGKAGLAGERRLLWVLLILVSALLLILFWRIWKRRKARISEVIIEEVAATPDLNEEDIAPDLLPEEGWQAMAQDLLGRGQLRLALRAMYMACLAYLARHNLIAVAKYKSNRDYQFDLQRRAHDRKLLLEAFSENVLLFEKTWYGKHEVTSDILARFDINQQQMREATANLP